MQNVTTCKAMLDDIIDCQSLLHFQQTSFHYKDYFRSKNSDLKTDDKRFCLLFLKTNHRQNILNVIMYLIGFESSIFLVLSAKLSLCTLLLHNPTTERVFSSSSKGLRLNSLQDITYAIGRMFQKHEYVNQTNDTKVK